MSGTKRVGRPMKEFLSNKNNDYNAEICYMKVVDKDVKKNGTNYCFG